MMQISVSYKSRKELVSLAQDAVLADLQKVLAATFNIDPSLQKIIHKGKLLKNSGSSLESLGVQAGSKLQLLGASSEQVAALHKERDELQRRAEVIATRKTTKPRNTSTAGFSSLNGQKDATPRFLKITPFPAGPVTPFFEKRKALLEKLASDPAILQIMTNDGRDLRVGNLTELHPHTSPTLLGLNENAGQQISLRLLTETLDGVHTYNAARRVLIHELTHNIHGGHELPFKELDSKMAKEVAAYAPSVGNRLGGDLGETYNPVEARQAENQLMEQGKCDATVTRGPNTSSLGQRLGGAAPEALEQSPSTEREARARAAEKRLGKEV